MPPHLASALAALPRLRVAELRAQFAVVFGEPTPSHNKVWLVRRIAWRVQAQAEGGLSERARQYALQITEDADLRLCPPKKSSGTQPGIRVAPSRQTDPRLPTPGTQLVKRYKDDTITVTVLADGFQHGERVYKSLSAIARQVTGTQWNGFSFFGLSSPKRRRRASQ